MSVLGLKSGYTVKYGLSPRDFPRAQVMVTGQVGMKLVTHKKIFDIG